MQAFILVSYVVFIAALADVGGKKTGRRTRRMGRPTTSNAMKAKKGKRHYPSLVALLLAPTTTSALGESKSSGVENSSEKGPKRRNPGPSSGEKSGGMSMSSPKHRQISPSPTGRSRSPSPTGPPSSSPSGKPISPLPTDRPHSSSPFPGPISQGPTPAPISFPPTDRPTPLFPSNKPISLSPTDQPTTESSSCSRSIAPSPADQPTSIPPTLDSSLSPSDEPTTPSQRPTGSLSPTTGPSFPSPSSRPSLPPTEQSISPLPSHRPSISPTEQPISLPRSHIPSMVPTLPVDTRNNIPCSSTQASTGAGTTVLSVDVLGSAGSFLLQYDFFEDPDSLVIEYEGQAIFATGVPVAFSSDVFVTLPNGGASSIVRVIIAAAPNSGATEWQLTIGCVNRR